MRALILAVVLIAGCAAKEQVAKPLPPAMSPQSEVKQEAKKPTQADYERMASEAIQRIEDQREAERKAIAKAEEDRKAKEEEAVPKQPASRPPSTDSPRPTGEMWIKRNTDHWRCRKCRSFGMGYTKIDRCPNCGSGRIEPDYRY